LYQETSFSFLSPAPAVHAPDFGAPLILIYPICFGGKPAEEFHNRVMRAFDQVVGE